MLIEPGTEAPAGIDPTMHTPAAVVTRMKADGAICVKTFFERGFGSARNLPVPKLETIRELVRAAHAAGLPVLIHANSSDAQAFAVEAGVDIVAHGLWNWRDTPGTSTEVTPEVKKILDGVLAGNLGWQPTIQVLYGERDLFNTTFLADPQLAQVLPASLIEWYRTPEGQWFHDTLAQGDTELKGKDPKTAEDIVFRDYATWIGRGEHSTSYLATRGARLLFGTDTPSAPTYANPPGLNGWLEMQRLVDANVTPAQIFQAATLSNARAMKLDGEIGTVSVGKKANLLLLRADPTQTVQAYSGIVKVILGGRVLEPASLSADHTH
jgi:imidazolonepropionase-like amidohydrolase